MYLRFLQLKRSGNVKLRNKMKKGKAGWFVVSMCFFGAGLVFMGNPMAVHADDVNGNNSHFESMTSGTQANTAGNVERQSVNNALTYNNPHAELQMSEKASSQPVSQAKSQGSQVVTNNLSQESSSKQKEETYSVPASIKNVPQHNETDNINQSANGDTTIVESNDTDDSGVWNLDSNGDLHMVSGTFNGSHDNNGEPDSSFFSKVTGSDDVKKIIIDGPTDGKKITIGPDATGGFFGFGQLESIEGLGNLDTSNTTNMTSLFQFDQHLRSADTDKLDTSAVTNMSNMFDASGFQSLDLSNFKTGNVINMSGMFGEMTDLSYEMGVNPDNPSSDSDNPDPKWPDPKVGIHELNLSNFDVNNVTSIEGMFKGDTYLNSIDLPNFDNAKVSGYVGAFQGCSNLKSIDLSGMQMKYADRYGATALLNVGRFQSYIDDVEHFNLKQIKVNQTTILQDSNLSTIDPTGIYSGRWVDDEGKIFTSKELESAYSFEGDEPRVAANYSWYIDTDVTIKTNLGDKVVHVTGPAVPKEGVFNVEVPEVDGYTPDLTKVDADVESTGITPTQSVIYTPTPKKPSGGSLLHSSSDKNTNSVEQLNQTVMTYHNQDNVKLYTIDGQEITNRELYPGTDWFSDEVVTRDNVKYYRVATNELVKAEDALVYVDYAATIVTKNGSPKSLSNEHSQSVSDRMLMSDTAWKTDRYAFFNGTKFYRVATNEWVNAEDVQDNL